MKKLILAGILATSLAAQAAVVAPLPQPWYVHVQKVLYLPIGAAISFAAVVTGNVPQLCGAIKGTYDKYGVDQCPDGQWSELVPFANKH